MKKIEKDDLKRILMICYYFYPLADVGSKRSVAFSKYFKEYGWEPHVLSVRNPDKAYCSIGKDMPSAEIHTEYSSSIINLYWLTNILNAILSRFLSLIGIHLKKNYFFEFLCIPDYFWGWIPLTILKGYKMIKKHKIDLIYVSCSPYSSGIIGLVLKRITGKPLVVDYRDPMALEVITRILKLSRLRHLINYYLDRKIQEYADIFVVNNEETKEDYIRQFSSIANKIHVVHNGFDVDHIIERNSKKYPIFTICYMGEFYFYAPYQNNIFFEAVAILKKAGRINKNNFQFIFFGDGKECIDQIARYFEIEDLVKAHSRIPHRAALEILSKSHLQLLRIVKPMISTKLFEGISLNIPFLATIPAGEAEKIIHQYSPSSFVVTEESPKAVAQAILDAMTKYRENKIQDNNLKEFLDCFSRQKLTLKLMSIIKNNLPT